MIFFHGDFSIKYYTLIKILTDFIDLKPVQYEIIIYHKQVLFY